MHSKGTHTLIGASAIVLGVALGIGVVYWDGANEQTLVVQAGMADCPVEGENNFTYSCNPTPKGKTCAIGKFCQEVVNGKPCTGTCQASGKCLGNACEGKALEGKPKEMPKEEGKGGGGMPPMPPMPMPKMPMPPMPDDPCGPRNALGTSTAGCAGRDAPSGISGYLTSLFGINTASSSTGGGISSTIQSVADKLTSFLTGGSSRENNTTATKNPTEAVVTSVTVTGSNTGGLSASGGTQDANTGQGTGGGAFSAVTGFRGGSAELDTSTGPILSAIKRVTARIQEILSVLF